MRICLQTRSYAGVSPSPGGGIGTRYAALGPALVRLGHEVHVVTTGREEGDEDRDGIGFHFVPARASGRLWFLDELPWSRAAARRLRALGRFDAVFAPEWGGGAWAYASRKSAGPLVTNLTTSMDQMVEISPGWRRGAGERAGNALQARLERRQTQQSDAIVACSHAILDWARTLWDLDGIETTVLPNFIDVARTRSLADGALPDGFPDDGPTVVFSGRLEPRKGAHVLGDAMRIVWDKRPDVRLVMLGADWTGATSERLRHAAGDKADRLHLLGDQPPERLFPGVAAADVVALPSMWEAFGLVALEAMALGRPCVLTSGSGFEEFFRDGEHGLLVRPGDAPALAAAIGRLLDDAEMRRRCGDAASAAADGYSAAALAPRYADFLGRVAAEAA